MFERNCGDDGSWSRLARVHRTLARGFRRMVAAHAPAGPIAAGGIVRAKPGRSAAQITHRKQLRRATNIDTSASIRDGGNQSRTRIRAGEQPQAAACSAALKERGVLGVQRDMERGCTMSYRRHGKSTVR